MSLKGGELGDRAMKKKATGVYGAGFVIGSHVRIGWGV